MSSWFLAITACLYFWAGIASVIDGKAPMALVMFSFFLSNMALAYAALK